MEPAARTRDPVLAMPAWIREAADTKATGPPRGHGFPAGRCYFLVLQPCAVAEETAVVAGWRLRAQAAALADATSAATSSTPGPGRTAAMSPVLVFVRDEETAAPIDDASRVRRVESRLRHVMSSTRTGRPRVAPTQRRHPRYKPDIIEGDMDSIRPEVRSIVSFGCQIANGCDKMNHHVIKLQLALAREVGRDYQSIVAFTFEEGQQPGNTAKISRSGLARPSRTTRAPRPPLVPAVSILTLLNALRHCANKPRGEGTAAAANSALHP